MSVKTFLQSLFKSEDSITLESVYTFLLEIKATQAKQQELIEQLLTKLSANNLTVVSQTPVTECGEILSSITKRRNKLESQIKTHSFKPS